jgi:hypothetical protein
MVGSCCPHHRAQDGFRAPAPAEAAVVPKLAPNAVPKYRLHKQSGQAIVTLSGRDFTLGRFQSPESREKYTSSSPPGSRADDACPTWLHPASRVARSSSN